MKITKEAIKYLAISIGIAIIGYGIGYGSGYIAIMIITKIVLGG